MKLDSPSRFTSFYESFSDLIFGTMAIFVLLMVVFLALVNPKSTSGATEKELDDARKQLAQYDEIVKEQNEQLSRLESSLKTKPINMVIAVDGSSSMGETLSTIQSTIESVAEIGSRIAPKFQLSIVVYRNKSYTYTFELRDILPTQKGEKSAGMLELNKWLNEKAIKVVSASAGSSDSRPGKKAGSSYKVVRLSPIQSIADIEHGINTALSQFPIISSTEQSNILIVTGDTGPWETEGRKSSVDAIALTKEKRILSSVRSFTSRSNNNRVLALFTGSKSKSLDFKPESIRFFKNLSAATDGNQGIYTSDTSQIAATLVEMMVENP